MHSTEIIGWFAHVGLVDRPTVGGKGGSLGEMTRAGIPVPPGFVVRTAAFERFLRALEAEDAIRPKVESLAEHELEKITALSQQVRARLEIAPLPDDVNAEILAAYAELCSSAPHSPLAVRSSATTEDAADASFAGSSMISGTGPSAGGVSCFAHTASASLRSRTMAGHRDGPRGAEPFDQAVMRSIMADSSS